MIMLRSMHNSPDVEILLFHTRFYASCVSGLAYGVEGSWEVVSLA